MFNQWETALIVCVLTLVGSFVSQRLMKLVDKKYSRDLKLFEKSFQACENLLSDAIPLSIFLRIPIVVDNKRDYCTILDMLQTPQKFSDTIIQFRDKYSKYEVYLDYKTKLICSKLIYYMRMQEFLFYSCYSVDPRQSPHCNIYNNGYLSIAMTFSSMYEVDCIELIRVLNIHNAEQLGGKITKRKFTVLTKEKVEEIEDKCVTFFKSSNLSNFKPPQIDIVKMDSMKSQSNDTILISKTQKSHRSIRKRSKVAIKRN